MYLFFTLATLLVSSAIAREDWLQRAVRWAWFPALLAITLGSSSLVTSPAEVVQFTAFNLGLLVLQWLLIAAWFSAKHGQWNPVVGRSMGWGDVLFLLAVAPAFSPLNFLLFYLGGTLVVLLAYLGYRHLSPNAPETIPLAGGLAALFALVQILLWNLGPELAFDDSWIQLLFLS